MFRAGDSGGKGGAASGQQSTRSRVSNSFSPCENFKNSDMLFTSHNPPHIALGNQQCLKLFLGNTKKHDLSISLGVVWLTAREVVVRGEGKETAN